MGTAIRAARKAKGLSQEALAKLADMDRYYMSEIERSNYARLEITKEKRTQISPSPLFWWPLVSRTQHQRTMSLGPVRNT
ncbi:helix-turn-helix transcriptional regulator [Methylotenera sp.]|uniref:helix-turn-helix transcriptional regulator n=1 Tax=Methylotenera sp. TaxID=2051956 RepID=UPI00345C4406